MLRSAESVHPLLSEVFGRTKGSFALSARHGESLWRQKKREMCITRGIVQLIFLMLVCAPNQVVTSNDVNVIIILRLQLHFALKYISFPDCI